MSREKLIKAIFKEQKITINGEDYLIKEMNAKDAAAFDKSVVSIVDDKVKYNMEVAKIRLTQATLCDADGKRIFGKADLGLIEALPSSIVNEIFQIASDMNNMESAAVIKN